MCLDADIIYDEVKVILEYFKDLLLTNNCCTDHLKEDLEVLFDHINRCFKIFCRKMLANYFSHWFQSLKHDTLELLLHIWLDNDQRERYGDVEMFLKEYPDCTIRKKKTSPTRSCVPF